jgi:hypothetical protein
MSHLFSTSPLYLLLIFSVSVTISPQFYCHIVDLSIHYIAFCMDIV